MNLAVVKQTDNAELDTLALKSDARQGERVIEAVYRFLERFVAYPSKDAHVAHALWVIHTHMMDAWETTPRIAFLSAEPASGKTRALEITELLVPNPVSAVNVTPAYLFRKIGAEGSATILYDEIDTVFGPKAKENEEIRGLLNAGNSRFGKAGRCVIRGKNIETEEISAYSAVALAGLGWLPDTILSRSIVIRMRRRHQGEQVEPFRRRVHAPEGERVRSLVETWAQANTRHIEWPHLPSEINDRDADVWEPLIAVADRVGGVWPETARKAGVALVAAGKEKEPSLGIRLLADLRTIFEDFNEMSSKMILSRLIEIEESPWGDIRGRQLDERGLAKRLKAYGIKSKTVRIGDATPRGYTRADLFDAWTRYLPAQPGTSETSATSATHQAHHAGDVAHVAELSGYEGGPSPDERSFNLEEAGQ